MCFTASNLIISESLWQSLSYDFIPASVVLREYAPQYHMMIYFEIIVIIFEIELYKVSNYAVFSVLTK